MTDDLVERARTAAEKVYGTQFFNVEIEAAIAVVLEEAAKEVEKWQQVHFDDGGNMHVSNITSTIAAAIRALVKHD
jgi:uncharacterized membrane protein